MATGSMTIAMSASPVNQDMTSSGVFTASVSSVSGSPPSGASITGGTLYFNNIRVYTSRSIYFSVSNADSSTTYVTTEDGNYQQSSGGSLNLNLYGYIVSALTISSGQSLRIHYYNTGSGNVLNLRNASVTLTLTYEYDESSGFVASTGTLNKTSVPANNSDTITMTVSGANASSCTHSIVWKIGSYSQTTSVTGAGSSTVKIPYTWCNAIASSSSGTCTATLTTLYGSKTIGSRSYTFTITVPNDSNTKPTISSSSYTVTNPKWDLCVQGFSTINLSASASGKYGASISSYTFTGPGDFSSTKSTGSASVSSIPSGSADSNGKYTLTYSVTAKDSRGYTSNAATITVTVYAYSNPSIGATSAYRTNSSGTTSENGTYITAQGAFTYSTVGGKNSASMTISYKASDATSWTTGQSNALSGQQYTFGNGGVSVAKTYSVRFTVTDSLGKSTYKEIALGTVGYCMFFKRGGLGVGIGMQTARPQSVAAFEVSSDWDMYWGSDTSVRIPGMVISSSEPASGRDGMIWLKPVEE